MPIVVGAVFPLLEGGKSSSKGKNRKAILNSRELGEDIEAKAYSKA